MDLNKMLSFIIVLLSLTLGLLKQEIKYILIGALLLVILGVFIRYKKKTNSKKLI